jgi:predicted ATPase
METKLKEKEKTKQKAEQSFLQTLKSVFGMDDISKPSIKPDKLKESHTQREKIEKLLLRKNRVQGVYLWGSPGSGKTFLMDLLYHELNTPLKSRFHFNEFMLNVHQRIHQINEINVFSIYLLIYLLSYCLGL